MCVKLWKKLWNSLEDFSWAYRSEDTQNGGGANDGRSNASFGTTVIPIATPEPPSILLFGVGLLSLAEGSWF